MHHRIMVPSTSPDIWKRYAQKMAQHFGGVSATPVTGLWIDPSGDLVEDKGVFLTSARQAADKALDPFDRVFMQQLASHVATDLTQLEVYVDTVEGDFRTMPAFDKPLKADA